MAGLPEFSKISIEDPHYSPTQMIRVLGDERGHYLLCETCHSGKLKLEHSAKSVICLECGAQFALVFVKNNDNKFPRELVIQTQEVDDMFDVAPRYIAQPKCEETEEEDDGEVSAS